MFYMIKRCSTSPKGVSRGLPTMGSLSRAPQKESNKYIRCP